MIRSGVYMASRNRVFVAFRPQTGITMERQAERRNRIMEQTMSTNTQQGSGSQSQTQQQGQSEPAPRQQQGQTPQPAPRPTIIKDWAAF